METSVRWSPHCVDNASQFLLLDILNSSISLHEVLAVSKSKIEHKEIASYTKLPHFAAFDWSKTSAQIVALGHVSGSASLIKIKPGTQTSEILTTYRARQQRRCNSIALSTQNWLAVALDKTRSDLCLNIYDAESTSPEPIHRLCPAELISSVRFFTERPKEVLAGAQRAFVRLYDLRDGFAGNLGNLQVATRNVNNITIDPLDENYFAAGGSTDDPSVTVWDKRWLSQNTTSGDAATVFEFKPALDDTVRTSVWNMRYSGLRRGQLALCSSTGELKLIKMLDDHSSSTAKLEYPPPNTHGGNPWSVKRYIGESRVLEKPSFESQSLVNRAVAFDWISSSQTHLEQKMIVLRANRTIEPLTISARPAASIGSRSSLSMALDGLQTSSRAPWISIQAQLQSNVMSQTQHHEDASQTVYNDAVETTTRSPMLSSLLSAEDLPRNRCKSGYLFDCSVNLSITSDHWQLQQLWNSIQHLKTLAAHDGMVYESVDFAYVGISGLWSEQAGPSPQRRLSPSPTKPSEAIIGLSEKRDLPLFEGERTDYPEHRQICLAVCGWRFKVEDLELECQELIERGLHYRAIVQAVLHGAKHLALNLLRTLIRSKTIQNIGLGALLAADELNEEQREMTLWMAADTEDPALKALLTFLHSGDWRDVMKTSYLHLGYRLALGLKYLNDTELNGFIQSETATAIRKGDLEGVLLTGLTEQCMDLFQTYITKTNDLQTAVLATAFTNPLYVDDPRWSMWKETYFMQMQAWRAFAERAKFVVEHNRIARTREGGSPIEPAVLQPKLRCAHGHGDVSRSVQKTTKPKASTPAMNAGTVCFSCGRQLPRCGVCTLWLNAPDPRKARQTGKAKQSSNDAVMERMLVFCTNCDHGSHAHHAREWFAQYNVCPVPGCACQCSAESSASGYSLADLWQTA